MKPGRSPEISDDPDRVRSLDEYRTEQELKAYRARRAAHDRRQLGLDAGWPRPLFEQQRLAVRRRVANLLLALSRLLRRLADKARGIW